MIELMEGIYILHFDYPFKMDSKFQYGDCTHYVGKASHIYKRIEQHEKGQGSNKTKLAKRLGITFTVFIFAVEASYKNEAHYTKKVREYCPLCTDFELDPTYNHRVSVGINKHKQLLKDINKGIRDVETSAPF